jgi:hypothetical protein
VRKVPAVQIPIGDRMLTLPRRQRRPPV